MKKQKLLNKMLSGASDTNFKIDELIAVLEFVGVQKLRQQGSHQIFGIADVPEIINLQSVAGGEAKPYQVKQVRQFIVKHKLIK